jgi:lipid-binding SYLF domain-containing protein
MTTSFRTLGVVPVILALCLLVVPGCQSADSAATPEEKEQAKLAKAEAKQQNLDEEAVIALREMTQARPEVADVVKRSYGYAVFPSVAKGGFVVGGASGKGVVYERGQVVAHAKLAQASVGFLVGGQSFRELIVFENREAFDKFKDGQLALGADAQVVALTAGGGGAGQFRNGLVVFVKPVGGAMFDVSAAGQKFTVEPITR